MSRELSVPGTTRRPTGWLKIAGIVFFYMALFVVNYWLPNGYSNTTSRLWNWTQTALTVGACFTLIVHRRSVTTRTVLLGFILATLSGLSHWMHNPSFLWSIQEGVAVWVCFVAGVILFKEGRTTVVSAFQPPLAKTGRSVVVGILFATPLTIVNNLYFYLSTGSIDWQNVFYSVWEALSPAIHEEIIFRFFVLAFSLYLLRDSMSSRRATAIALFLAVVPHSLNHLPDLFLENPAMGVLMLIATSLLFGLPMALLQVRKNLEAAIAFHWCIDFVRFWFGY